MPTGSHSLYSLRVRVTGLGLGVCLPTASTAFCFLDCDLSGHRWREALEAAVSREAYNVMMKSFPDSFPVTNPSISSNGLNRLDVLMDAG